MLSSQYIDHFESLIYQQLSITNAQIQCQSKRKNFIFKMSISSFLSVEHKQNYNAIYPSNISNLSVSARRSRSYVPKHCKSQMRYISVCMPVTLKNRMTSACHDSLLEDDGLIVVVQSTHIELCPFLVIQFHFKFRVYTGIIRV